MMEPTAKSATDKLLVAAIDFGTTYSGYAFSFRHDFERDPLKISTNQSWSCGQGLVSWKTPTTVLFDDNKHFHAFGYDAEEKYCELAENDDHRDWFYFKRFKMLLHGKLGLTRDVMIEDAVGKEMHAKTVFACVIRFLRDHLLHSITSRGIDFTADDILWVLTVPAIWNEPAKQFMRECAVEGGIKTEQLKLALEPEAASVYCKTIPLERIQQMDGDNGDRVDMGPFLPGTKYMVLDLGGGTVDVTVHEVTTDGTLKELHKASGGAWGGIKVDASYFCMYSELFGQDVMTRFQKECKVDHLDMERDFEVKKRNIKNEESKVNIRLSPALADIARETKQLSPNDLVQMSGLGEKISFRRDRMSFEGSVMKQMFAEPVQSIVAHVHEVLGHPKVGRIDKILMVGGFSESPLIRNTVKEAFPDLCVIAPDDPGLAVLKGAVIYGHSPNAISSRIVRFTYGIGSRAKFYDGFHLPEKRVKGRNNEVLCKDVFSKFITVGSDAGVNETKSKEYDITDKAAPVIIEIYASTNENPMYITEDGCTKMGQVNIRSPIGGWRDKAKLRVDIGFGDAEFKVTATELTTQLEQQATFDFLS